MSEDVFNYDNSEPVDASWNTPDDGFVGTVSGNASPAPESSSDDGVQLGDLLDALDSSRSYGTMGDYYNQQIGCYVFPNYDVYAYFIDVEADGADWCEASDGHYIPVLYLDAYEAYIASDDAAESGEVIPTESELQNKETLENIQALLSVIQKNDSSYYIQSLEIQNEISANCTEISSRTEGILYGTIVGCILLALIAGVFVGHVFFGRMRVG
ncbi:MAG: hypothetical protein HDR09_16890 [Lachnospiraceae bacterium]|nr:hypothetical protein [Lachnospiraceae bacterium]